MSHTGNVIVEIHDEAALVRSAFPGLNTVKAAQRITSRSTDIGDPVRFRIDAAAAVAR